MSHDRAGFLFAGGEMSSHGCTDLAAIDPANISVGQLTLTSIGVAGDFEEIPSIDDFRQTLSFVERCVGGTNWWIGDLANYAASWGTEYTSLLEQVDVEPEVLRKCIQVARDVEFGIRIPSLSWTHHRIVSALTPREQRYWLKKAQPKEGGGKPRLSVSELRTAIREASNGPTSPEPLGFDAALDSLRAAVSRVLSRWPQGELVAAPNVLRDMADDLEAELRRGASNALRGEGSNCADPNQDSDEPTGVALPS